MGERKANAWKPDGIEVQVVVLAVMRRWRAEGALWTSDIAHGVKLPTAQVRRALVVLERDHKVRRVVTGNPTSWELADATHPTGPTQ